MEEQILFFFFSLSHDASTFSLDDWRRVRSGSLKSLPFSPSSVCWSFFGAISPPFSLLHCTVSASPRFRRMATGITQRKAEMEIRLIRAWKMISKVRGLIKRKVQ